MRILTVVGARPQFVKAAAVGRVLRHAHEEVLLHTGQHYDDGMSDVFFRELEIPRPDVQLGVGSGPHGEQTARMLTGIDDAIERYRPAMVLVYGDTNSTLAAALAAAKRQTPIAHVEAGLRSFNGRMPEEINRVVADRLAALLFCPSRVAVDNLAAEGVTRGVHLVGDVMRDAIDAAAARAASREGALLDRLGVARGGFVLATIHRADNTDDAERLTRIMCGLARSGLPVVLPIHPRTRAAIERAGVHPPDSIRIVDPLGYLDMIALERSARVVATDSGGVQKEAYWLGVPCVTLRDETEWVETVAAGWNRLAGSDPDAIARAIADSAPCADHPALYGDGRAAERIVEELAAS